MTSLFSFGDLDVTLAGRSDDSSPGMNSLIILKPYQRNTFKCNEFRPFGGFPQRVEGWRRQSAGRAGLTGEGLIAEMEPFAAE